MPPRPEVYPLRGIVPIVNTPFDDNLQVDFASLQRLIAQGIDDGVSGYIVPAVASEVAKLRRREREDMLRTVAAAAGGRADVVAGVSSESLAESRALAEHALSLGIQAVLCQVPQSLADDEDAVLRHFQELAAVGMPILMIQDLAWSGWGMRVELIARMFDAIECFRAIKVETVPAGAKYSAVLEATNNQIHVSCGWGLGQMIEALDRGVHAFTTTAINLPFVRVYRSYQAGRIDEARQLFDRMAPCLIWCQQHIDISIHFLKQYCVEAGIFTTSNVREPIFQYDEHHRRYGASLIRSVLEIEAQLRGEES